VLFEAGGDNKIIAESILFPYKHNFIHLTLYRMDVTIGTSKYILME